jgi:hypothetical protein
VNRNGGNGVSRKEIANFNNYPNHCNELRRRMAVFEKARMALKKEQEAEKLAMTQGRRYLNEEPKDQVQAERLLEAARAHRLNIGPLLGVHDRARDDVRHEIVRCEEALEFYRTKSYNGSKSTSSQQSQGDVQRQRAGFDAANSAMYEERNGDSTPGAGAGRLMAGREQFGQRKSDEQIQYEKAREERRLRYPEQVEADESLRRIKAKMRDIDNKRHTREITEIEADTIRDELRSENTRLRIEAARSRERPSDGDASAQPRGPVRKGNDGHKMSSEDRGSRGQPMSINSDQLSDFGEIVTGQQPVVYRRRELYDQDDRDLVGQVAAIAYTDGSVISEEAYYLFNIVSEFSPTVNRAGWMADSTVISTSDVSLFIIDCWSTTTSNHAISAHNQCPRLSWIMRSDITAWCATPSVFMGLCHPGQGMKS